MKGGRRGPRKKALEEDQAVTHSPTSSSPNKIPSLEINPNSSIHNHLHYLSLVLFFWMDIHIYSSYDFENNNLTRHPPRDVSLYYVISHVSWLLPLI